MHGLHSDRHTVEWLIRQRNSDQRAYRGNHYRPHNSYLHQWHGYMRRIGDSDHDYQFPGGTVGLRHDPIRCTNSDECDPVLDYIGCLHSGFRAYRRLHGNKHWHGESVSASEHIYHSHFWKCGHGGNRRTCRHG
jgi:hypothetical protein